MNTAFRAMVTKDLRLFLNDRRAVIMSFVAPIAIASFFGFVFGGLGGKTETSKIHVLFADEDGSTISQNMLTQLKGEKTLNVTLADAASAREGVRKGSAAVAIVIPKDFGDQAGRALFASSGKPEIALLYDPSHAAEQGMVQGILTGTVMQAVTKEVFGGSGSQKLLDEQRADIDASTNLAAPVKDSLRTLLGTVQNLQAVTNASGAASGSGGLTIPSEIHAEAVTARQGVEYNGYAHSFGGMGVQFILFMGIDMGVQLLLQRQRGLWKRLRAAPISRGLLLGSRAMSATLISMVIMLVLFGFARVVFGVRIEGSLAGFLLVCLTFSMMTGAFGLMVAALGRTPEATRGLSIFATLIMVMLGGAWVPTFIFPPWLQKLTVVIPTRWAIDGLDGVVWRGYHFADALYPSAVLVGYALVFGIIAVNRFRWEAEN
jgi:ABC-2 type transport system permease protein